jgi:hypothetical protein
MARKQHESLTLFLPFPVESLDGKLKETTVLFTTTAQCLSLAADPGCRRGHYCRSAHHHATATAEVAAIASSQLKIGRQIGKIERAKCLPAQHLLVASSTTAREF